MKHQGLLSVSTLSLNVLAVLAVRGGIGRTRSEEIALLLVYLFSNEISHRYVVFELFFGQILSIHKSPSFVLHLGLPFSSLLSLATIYLQEAFIKHSPLFYICSSGTDSVIYR